MDFRNLSEMKYYVKRNKIISRLYWKKNDLYRNLSTPSVPPPSTTFLSSLGYHYLGLGEVNIGVPFSIEHSKVTGDFSAKGCPEIDSKFPSLLIRAMKCLLRVSINYI